MPDKMRLYMRWLIAALAGGALVWALFWLVESVLPGSVALSLEAGRLLMGIAVLTASLFLGRALGALSAASFVAGGGVIWAVHEIDPLTMCQADTLYRPCTNAEIAWIGLVPFVLLGISAGIAVQGFNSRHRRRSLSAN